MPGVYVDKMDRLELEAFASMNCHDGYRIETVCLRGRDTELPVIADAQPAAQASNEAADGLVRSTTVWHP